MCMLVSVHVHMYLYICLRVNLPMRMHVCVCACVCACVICMSVHMSEGALAHVGACEDCRLILCCLPQSLLLFIFSKVYFVCVYVRVCIQVHTPNC